MSSINDVVIALKAKVGELGSFISDLRERLDAAHASYVAAVVDLDAARAENHDLRNQLQALTLASASVEYDPAADLQSVIDHLDALMGRNAPVIDVVSYPGHVIVPELPAVEAPVEEEVAPLDSAPATPSTVEDSSASLVEAPVEPTLTLVTSEFIPAPETSVVAAEPVVSAESAER